MKTAINTYRDERIAIELRYGAKTTDLAKKYGISQSRVSQIKKEMEDRERGKDYVIKNGAEDIFLTEIQGQNDSPVKSKKFDKFIKGNPVYVYATKDPRKAMRFTLEDAQQIAKERHAKVCLPV